MRSTVHVVDDDACFRTAIARLLRLSGYDVAEYESGKQLLDRVPAGTGPGCILLDVQIPDVSGPEVQVSLAELGSTWPILFLTGHGDIATGVQAIKRGALDFLTKPVPTETLLTAIEQAIASSLAKREQHDRLEAWRALIASLTPRERRVFELVVRGRLNKQIAHELGTTERTIKAHRQKVMAKIRVHSIAELVSIAERLAILSPPAA